MQYSALSLFSSWFLTRENFFRTRILRVEIEIFSKSSQRIPVIKKKTRELYFSIRSNMLCSFSSGGKICSKSSRSYLLYLSTYLSTLPSVLLDFAMSWFFLSSFNTLLPPLFYSWAMSRENFFKTRTLRVEIKIEFASPVLKWK